MTRFHGVVGYGETVETVPGVHELVITERQYFGDVVRDTRNLAEGETLNGDLTLSSSISIVADPYAYEHYYNIKFVQHMGLFWKVTAVEPRPGPRMILRIGEVYNGPRQATEIS